MTGNIRRILKTFSVCCCAAALILLSGCAEKKEVLFSGQTMGTTYHIKVVSGRLTRPDRIHADIEKRLADINESMSIFLIDSDISRFNALTRTDKKLRISDDFYQVMRIARRLHDITQGAWDGTIHPLVQLWGFGSKKSLKKPPSAKQIEAVLPHVGFDGIEMTPDRYLKKNLPTVTLDLASVAKGYAVDAVSALLAKNGFNHFLVEIGGEVYASGVRQDGLPWKVGINMPSPQAPRNQVYKVLALKDEAMATSGDYRNYFQAGEKRYAHVLDPKTGYPVTNGVVSVTVLSTSCALADGLATALMVLGPEKGLDLINRIDAVECLMVVREKSGRLVDFFSKGFPTGVADT